MKPFFRALHAIAQLAVVIWAVIVVCRRDLHNPDDISYLLAALVFRGWFSKDINDPLFGRDTPQAWLLAQFKRLAPKRQPKERYDI
jgi:hypothetical protein